MGPEIVRESCVQLDSRLRVNYAEAGRENNRVLILLHGYTDSWRSYALALPLLSQTHRVLALDFRGHGGSSKPDGDYSTTRLAADVLEFMNQLDIGSAAVVGHCMGGFVARRLALEHPGRVECLVLVATALTPNNCEVRALTRQVEEFTETIPAEFIRDFQTGCVARPAHLAEGFLAMCLAASAKVPPHVWHAALRGLTEDNQTYRLGTIACPTLVIGGRHDAVFSPVEQEQVVRAIPGAQGRFYRHAGHSPHWEEPARFAEDVQDFLETH